VDEAIAAQLGAELGNVMADLRRFAAGVHPTAQHPDRSESNQQAARKVLSSALSWGVESRTYRRWLPTNGAKLVTGRRRRSTRAHAAARADVRLPRSRVFDAFDYELVRAELVARTDQRT
jgi:hypothetical protein